MIAAACLIAPLIFAIGVFAHLQNHLDEKPPKSACGDTFVAPCWFVDFTQGSTSTAMLRWFSHIVRCWTGLGTPTLKPTTSSALGSSNNSSRGTSSASSCHRGMSQTIPIAEPKETRLRMSYLVSRRTR